MNNIALFTIALGNDPVYFNSVKEYCFKNKINFAQKNKIDYYLFTDRSEVIDGIINISVETIMWPYIALLKNNIISNYLTDNDKWSEYSHIFFIDADFAIGNEYDFFNYEFIFLKPHWNSLIAGGFYGGETVLFKQLADMFYIEINYICSNKLSVPYNLDEFYLGLFYLKNIDKIHIIEMKVGINTQIFYDDQDVCIENKLFLHPYKSKGRANKQLIIDAIGNQNEYTLSIAEGYIFNNYTKELGRIFKEKKSYYRILWNEKPEIREVLNVIENKISRYNTMMDQYDSSPIISIVMPIYNVRIDYLTESIKSVLNQSFKKFEFLIIDDGSTILDYINVINDFNDPRVRVIINHHDFVDSLNKGISESRGKYIARMDGDDVMLPHRLEAQYEFMEKNVEVDICGSWMRIIGDCSGVIETFKSNNEIISSLLLFNTMAHPTIIMKKSTVCINDEPLYKHGYTCAEDYKLWTDLVKRNLCFANIPEYLLCYRHSSSQTTKNKRIEMDDSVQRIKKEFTQFVMEKICEKKPQYEMLFNNLIELYNKELIHLTELIGVVYQFYIEFHLNKNT